MFFSQEPTGFSLSFHSGLREDCQLLKLMLSSLPTCFMSLASHFHLSSLEWKLLPGLSTFLSVPRED